MKKNIIISLVFITIIVFSCIYYKYSLVDYSLNKDSIAFDSLRYDNPKKDGDSYHMIKYKNNSYVYYGELKTRIKNKDVKKVLGYIKNDVKTKNIRVVALNKTDNYLMVINTHNKQISFYRRLSTVNKNIFTPDYIKSLNYDIWK